ncbi:MAG TPA: pyridoxal phosphate-dependent aminotransferase [Woeseiaceae bacterium]|nr:pyridoxal phosphate-dependent aminotransferase [Woeseiaceae bacterium]
MTIRIRPAIAGLPLSPTLGANQSAQASAGGGQPLLHMGFGQSPFPVHPRLADALAAAATRNAYDDVAGLAELRARAKAYFCDRLGLDASAYECIVAPGSKLVLYALQMAIEGDLLLPMPSWVSYAPQAAMLGDRVHWLPADLSDDGYRIDAGRLEALILDLRSRGANPTKLILNSPNNPTGLAIPAGDVEAIVDTCERHGIFLISDEIYALTAFDGTRRSIAAHCAGTAAVTTGLSKHLSLGGWRLGFGLVPASQGALLDSLNAIASETWSCVAGPIQEAALLAVAGEDDIEDYIRHCTSIHATVARVAAERIASANIDCPRPQGAFYLWPDFEAVRQRLAEKSILTSRQLADALLEQKRVLALPGTAFGAPPEQLALRLSVCDYKGDEALAACANHEISPDQVAGFAPRVVAAADAIAAFAEQAGTA